MVSQVVSGELLTQIRDTAKPNPHLFSHTHTHKHTHTSVILRALSFSFTVHALKLTQLCYETHLYQLCAQNSIDAIFSGALFCVECWCVRGLSDSRKAYITDTAGVHYSLYSLSPNCATSEKWVSGSCERGGL